MPNFYFQVSGALLICGKVCSQFACELASFWGAQTFYHLIFSCQVILLFWQSLFGQPLSTVYYTLMFLTLFPVTCVLILVTVFLQSIAANKLETCWFEMIASSAIVGQAYALHGHQYVLLLRNRHLCQIHRLMK